MLLKRWRLLVVAGTALHAGSSLMAQTVTDPGMLLEATRLAFPNADTIPVSAPKDGHPAPFFRDSPNFYEIVAPVTPDEAGFATSLIDPEKISSRRLVQTKVISHRIGLDGDIYIAVFNYSFLVVDHSTDGQTTARFAIIRRRLGTWAADVRHLEEVNPFISRVDFLDFSPQAPTKLVVTVDTGDYRWQMRWLLVFNIGDSGFQWFGRYEIESRGQYKLLSAKTITLYKKELDLPRTQALGGEKLVFRVTTFVNGDQILAKPNVTEEIVGASDEHGRG